MIYRDIKNIIMELLVDFRIIYLTGSRQAGKSTIVRLIAKELNMNYYTLDNSSIFQSAKIDPHGLINSLGKKVVIDEFQYAPELIPAIKMVSDSVLNSEKGIFLLTGSADIFRSTTTQEALPGHMARVELYPLSQSEIKESHTNIVDYLFNEELEVKKIESLGREKIANILINGGYPEAISKSRRSQNIWFKSYITGRLYKDFENMYEKRGDYLSKVDALVRLLAGLSGNLIKYASIGNDLNQDDKTVKKYMEILDLMFIIKRVEPYVRNSSKRAVVGMQKLYFIDSGLACYLLGLKKPQTLLKSQFYGGLLESFIAMEIIKHSGFCLDEIKIYHFRDKLKNEVDIVLESDDGMVVGIEIKASMSLKKEDFKGLSILSDYAGEKFLRGVIFYSGGELLPFKIDENRFYAVPISFLW